MEKRLMRGELIGRNIEITDSKKQAKHGLKGKIIDETKNMIQIITKEGIKKKLIKNNITFALKMDGKEFRIKGREIRFAPEERIKIR